MAKKWNRESLVVTRQQVLSLIAEASEGLSGEERLNMIGKKIQEWEQAETPEAIMQRYYLVIAALEHHEQQGGLTSFQVEKLAELAEKILNSQGIKPISSVLAYTHAHVHDLLSQIFRKSGRLWQSAWQQHLAEYSLHNRTENVNNTSYQHLCHGNRALRLGYSALSIEHYRSCMTLSQKFHGLASLGLIKCLWLSGKTDEARRVLTEASSHPRDESIAREFRWLQNCMAIQASGDWRELVVLTRKGSEFYSSSYVIEAVLWLRACPDQSLAEEMPKYESMMRNRTLDLNIQLASFRCIQDLERCHDKVVPLVKRIARLGKMLGRTDRLLTVEQELLALAASLRWLQLSRVSAFSGIVRERYLVLSLALSNGTNKDALGVIQQTEDQASTAA